MVVARKTKPFFHRSWWETKLAQGRENPATAEEAPLERLTIH
jgi:hypothetical protein